MSAWAHLSDVGVDSLTSHDAVAKFLVKIKKRHDSLLAQVICLSGSGLWVGGDGWGWVGRGCFVLAFLARGATRTRSIGAARLRRDAADEEFLPVLIGVLLGPQDASPFWVPWCVRVEGVF